MTSRLEYMIVDRERLSVLPIADRLLHRLAGRDVAEVQRRRATWSNEIVLHRILPYTDAQVVAKEGEEAMLVREMQNDSAAQIVRRLSAVKTAGFPDLPYRVPGARIL